MAEYGLPVVVGVGQVTQRTADLAEAQEPLALMETAARRAEEDAGVPGLLARADSVQVVNVFSWPSPDPPGDLAARLGAEARERLYSAAGGNAPQWLVNETADRLARGRVRLALIAGAEAMHSYRRARAAGAELPWTPRSRPQVTFGVDRPGTTDVENAHHADIPIRLYPLFENALRAHYGESIPEHQQRIGALFSRFTQVAAANPYAWCPQARTAEELAQPAPDNRWIAFPYPKRLNAIMEVDQGAALILTTDATARELGIPRDRWVYLWSGAHAHDRWFVSDRVNYYTSPAIRAVGRAVLELAGLTIDRIDFFDLYSCFPSVVQIACDMLGIPRDDPRPLTVTGGLPYFGGPGNNYTTHAIAAMVERLRARPGTKGLVTANGYYVTKHAAGIYSAEPPPGPWRPAENAAIQAEVEAQPGPPVADRAEGDATIETYTVVFGRDGEPEYGIVIGRLADGRRFVANAFQRDALLAWTREEAVGLRGRVSHDPSRGVNVFQA